MSPRASPSEPLPPRQSPLQGLSLSIMRLFLPRLRDLADFDLTSEDMARRGADVGQDSFVVVRSWVLDGFHAPLWRVP